MKIHLASDDVNLLVYRYLLENGYVHSAFAFRNESGVGRRDGLTGRGERIPPNGLLAFLQKALLYCWIEHHTDDNSGDVLPCSRPFSFFAKHECWYSKDDAAQRPPSELLSMKLPLSPARRRRQATDELSDEAAPSHEGGDSKRRKTGAPSGAAEEENGRVAPTQLLHPRATEAGIATRVAEFAPRETGLVVTYEGAAPALFGVGAEALALAPPRPDAESAGSSITPGHSRGTAVSWAGQSFAVGQENGCIHFWTSAGGFIGSTVPEGGGPVTMVEYSDDARFLVSAQVDTSTMTCGGQNICIWRIDASRLPTPTGGGSFSPSLEAKVGLDGGGCVAEAEWRPTTATCDQPIVAVGCGHRVHFLSRRESTPSPEAEAAPAPVPRRAFWDTPSSAAGEAPFPECLDLGGGSVVGLKWSKDGRTLAIALRPALPVKEGERCEVLKIWDVSQKAFTARILSTSQRDIFMDWRSIADDQHHLVVANGDGCVALYAPPPAGCGAIPSDDVLTTVGEVTLEPVHTISFGPTTFSFLRVNPIASDSVAIGSAERTLLVVGVENGPALRVRKEIKLDAPVSHLSWDASGRRLAVCSAEPQVFVVDLQMPPNPPSPE
eukprot:Polyplicarium_translucidae@DN3391_c1_g2_i10.p1